MRGQFTFRIQQTVAVLCLLATGYAQTYSVKHLGVLRGGSGVPLAVKNHGDVVGRSGQPHGEDTRAFLAPAQGPTQNLGALAGGDYSIAYGINDNVQVVGASNTASAAHAFLWTSRSGLRDLGTLPGDDASEAFAINSTGQVAGFSSGPSGMRAFRWSAASGFQALPTPAGFQGSRGLGINDAGQVVGELLTV